MARGTWKSRQSSLQAAASNKAVVYLRVSTDEQVKHGKGMAAQLDACEAYARSHGFEIIDIVSDEGLSGSLPMSQRPSLAHAFDMCRSGQAGIILAYAQDRFARDSGVWVEIRKRAILEHVQLVTVKEAQDFTTKESQFMGDIHAAVAAEERRRIAERLVGGRRERSKKDGRGSGPVPFGYVRVGSGRESSVVIDEQAASIVRLILSLRDQGDTFQAISDQLNEQGYRTATGVQWTRGHVKLVDQKRSLYRTGSKEWGDVASSDKWPVIIG